MARTQGSHADITGPRIRAVALRLLAAEGYAAVSMRRIASEVGVQVGALYNYTPDKQSLLFELMQAHLANVLASRPTGGGEPEVRLEAFVRFHLRFHVDRRDEIFVSYNELRNLSPENFAVIEGMRRDYETGLSKILQEMEVPEPRISAMAIIALLTGFTTWYRADGRLDLATLQDVYWNMVRGLVGLR